MSCSTCGAGVPAGARFCPSCGAPQTSGVPQAEERRIVTVLFADLVGFTTLAERLDPEQVKRLVDTCFQRMVEVVLEYGGRVDKILGDGMLVLFGAPVAHEDDPERAVRAGLRMQSRLAELVAESGRVGIDDVRMRVGITTGEVLVGTLAGSDYTAMGDTVNLASRLQSAAPPGGVLVGETTHALTAHTFRFEPFGEVQPKGREQSVQAWLAMEAVAPPGATRRRRRDLCFVGRSEELTIAMAGIELVARHGRGMVLHIAGENGVGKSRLVDEVITRLRAEGDVTVLEGACVPYGESNVWWPITTALTNHLDLDSTLPLATIREHGLARSALLFPGNTPKENEQLVDVFAHLLGHPSPLDRLDPTSARSTVCHTVAKVLEAKSHSGPIVLSIDDLHWADPVLVELLDSLVLSLSRHPFVLITAMRPGADIAWPTRSERTTVLSLMLQPFSREENDTLARELFTGEEPDETMLSALYDRSGGNPLFLIELVALTESGVGHELPDSLRTLIAARLDQLTVPQRQVLENAAVLGTTGAVGALEEFAEALGQELPAGTLQELDELGLLDLHGRRWEFSSDSVRDAAYQTLTKAARAQRHAGVAQALHRFNPGSDDLAHHLASAAELVQELGAVDGVPRDIDRLAVHALTQSAQRAVEGGSLRTAVRHATRALDLLHGKGGDELLAKLHRLRAQAAIDQRHFESAAGDIATLDAIAQRTDDTSLLAEAHRLRGIMAHSAGRPDDARAELGAAVDLLRRADSDPAQLALTLRNRGFIEMFSGSLADAEWFFGEADELFRSLDDVRGQAYIEQHRAWISFMSGDMTLARERLTHAAATHTQLGDRNGVGWAFGLLAFIEFFERNFDEAERLAITVSQEAELRGDEWAAGMMDTLRADLALWRGHLEVAYQLAEKARNRFKRLEDRFGLIQSLAPLVRAQVGLGRFAAAQRSSEELIALSDQSRQGPMPLMAVAGAAMHRGQATIAAAMAERAIVEMRAIGANAFEPMVVRAAALVQLGQPDEALAAVESVPEHGADHPFTHAVSALVLTSMGSPKDALRHAHAVEQEPGATYLDEVFAYVAAAGAWAQLGDPAQAELSAQAAVARAIAVGDVVATALATHAYRAVTGESHPAYDDRTQLGEGWEHVVQQLRGKAA